MTGGKVIHWQRCKQLWFEVDICIENEKHKIICDFLIDDIHNLDQKTTTNDSEQGEKCQENFTILVNHNKI